VSEPPSVVSLKALTISTISDILQSSKDIRFDSMRGCSVGCLPWIHTQELLKRPTTGQDKTREGVREKRRERDVLELVGEVKRELIKDLNDRTIWEHQEVAMQSSLAIQLVFIDRIVFGDSHEVDIVRILLHILRHSQLACGAVSSSPE
jgi:hypothetical protein